MPDSFRSAEKTVYERVRAEIAANKIQTTSGEVGITISIGVTDSRKNNAADAMLTSADAALYKAKDNGRNQVVFDGQ